MFLDIIFVVILIALSIELIIIWIKKKDIWIPRKNFTRISDRFPIEKVEQKFLIGKDKSYLNIIKLDGFDKFNATEEHKKNADHMFIKWLDEINHSGVRLKLITMKISERKSNPSKKISFYIDKINKRWNQVTGDAFLLEHYLIIKICPRKRRFFKEKIDSLKVLNHITHQTIYLLQPFNPKLLSKDDGWFYSFLHKYLLGPSYKEEHKKLTIPSLLSRLHMVFDAEKGLIKRSDCRYPFQAGVAFLSWDPLISDEIMNTIMRMPTNTTIVTDLKGMKSIQASGSLRYQKKQLKNYLVGKTLSSQIDEALDSIENHDHSLYQLETTCWIQSETVTESDQNIDVLIHDLQRLGVTATKLYQEIEVLWWSTIPGMEQQIYSHRFLSTQIACIISWPKIHSGFLQSDWGLGAIQPIRTVLGNTYQFQWHVDDSQAALAHSLVIAPSGSGKTTLYQHLIAGSMQKDVRAYIFDRNQGTRIFTESSGGIYNDFSTNMINPMVYLDNDEDKEFLSLFLMNLIEANSPEDKDEILKCVNILETISKKNRLMNRVIDLIFSSKSRIKKRMLQYVYPSHWSRYINGSVSKNSQKIAYDMLDMNSHLMSFDLAPIWGNNNLLFSMIQYLFHRIKLQAKKDKKPHLIFIDEASSMLSNHHFSLMTKEILLEHRKLRGSISLSFQNPRHINQNKLGNVILEQCPTKVIFPNPYATKEDYDILNLTDLEWLFIKKKLPINQKMPHLVLIKRPNESVILDIDFNELGSLLKLYHSDANSIRAAQNYKEKYGHIDWVRPYLYG